MASFNPLALLAERTCASIYNAIDTGNNAQAVRQADLVLKSQPDLALASALKSVALVRQGKHKEAHAVCDKLVARGLRRGEEGVLTSFTWALGRLGRRTDEVKLLEDAVKLNPNDQALARQCFMALIRSRLYQKAQQLSLKMSKTFATAAHRAGKQGRFIDEYFWWSIQSYLLLARDPTAPGAALALPLSQRMIEKQIEAKPLTLNDEEALWLQLQVLIRQNKSTDALDLLTQGIGATLCDRNLSLEFLRTELAQKLGKWELVAEYNKARIEAGSTNWAHFSSYLEAAAKLGKTELESADALVKRLVSTAQGRKDRSIRLAELQLRKSQTLPGTQEPKWAELIISYFEQFGSKACCHEDVLPYLSCMSRAQQDDLSRHLAAVTTSTESEAELRTKISVAKIHRTVQDPSTMTTSAETALAVSLMQDYTAGLQVGAHLPETEMQPADDLALLAAHALLSAYLLSQYDLAFLLQAIALLEYALTKSKKGYQLRVLLIRCYTLVGAFDRASIHYGLLGLKSVQSDTLSYLVSDRTSCFSAVSSASSTDDALSKMVVRSLSGAQGIYEENAQSTPDMVTKAFEHGIYSRVEEFVEFGEMLDRSVQRQVLRLEEARCHFLNRKNADKPAFQAGMTKTVAAVTASLKEGGGKLHDQRDRTVLVNYQPLGTPTVEELTRVGPQQGTGWVKSMHFLLAHAAGTEKPTEPTELEQSELTDAERKAVQIAVQVQNGSFKDEDLVSLVVDTKAQLKAEIERLTAKPSVGRPIDVIHTAALLLETVYHAPSVSDAAKTEINTHLAELATLISHLSRSVPTDIATAALTEGLSSLPPATIAQLAKNTQDNVAKSLQRTLDAVRDALRGGC